MPDREPRNTADYARGIQSEIGWDDFVKLDLVNRPVRISGFLPVAGRIGSVERDGDDIVIRAVDCKFGTQQGVKEGRDQIIRMSTKSDDYPRWLVGYDKTIMWGGRVTINMDEPKHQ